MLLAKMREDAEQRPGQCGVPAMGGQELLSGYQPVGFSEPEHRRHRGAERGGRRNAEDPNTAIHPLPIRIDGGHCVHAGAVCPIDARQEVEEKRNTPCVRRPASAKMEGLPTATA